MILASFKNKTLSKNNANKGDDSIRRKIGGKYKKKKIKRF